MPPRRRKPDPNAINRDTKWDALLGWCQTGHHSGLPTEIVKDGYCPRSTSMVECSCKCHKPKPTRGRRKANG